ncbi:Recombination repair protein 1 [Pseudolycoriella hygida]|uniref:DNA repair nuclease/redox regulator APEX1 n=1 Tax=Pseudolycoriella hygida TaxID=35572 RepID=A0A9Q0NGZ1_9DIPT|nr:Recombination repair protein 1 [Pseudolycoriella hygida]
MAPAGQPKATASQPKATASQSRTTKRKASESLEALELLDLHTMAPAGQPKATASQPKATKRKASESLEALESLDLFMPSEEFNFKITTWNVAGLRALVKKDGMKFCEKESPHIICLQETKCLEEEVPKEALLDGYHKYWLGMKGGHAGVALLSKNMPYEVTYGLKDAEMDDEARLITAEYTRFYVLCVYVPNSGRKLVNLDKRMRWDDKFRNYLLELNKRKPVIVCGDMNVSHLEIDLANPKSNKRNAGFTKEERDNMTKMLDSGFVDTFRQLYPDKTKAYTYWTYMANARAKNVGWRLDYFIVSEKLSKSVVDNVIRSSVGGSDHCPVTLFLKL